MGRGDGRPNYNYCLHSYAHDRQSTFAAYRLRVKPRTLLGGLRAGYSVLTSYGAADSL